MIPITDQLAMLLSTDWFLGQRTLLCPKSDESAQVVMQQKCRAIVEYLLDGASDYWQVSFKDARLRDTSDSFFTAAVESGLHDADIELLRVIANQSDSTEKEADNISLLGNLTQLLISESSSEVIIDIPEELIARIAPFFLANNVSRSVLVSLCLGSTSVWDRNIREKTTDIPDMLGDFLLTLYKQTYHFVEFWRKVVENTSSDERTQLLEWYRRAANELTMRHLEFPQWM